MSGASDLTGVTVSVRLSVRPLAGQQAAAERENQAGGHHDPGGNLPQRELTEASRPSGAGTSAQDLTPSRTSVLA